LIIKLKHVYKIQLINMGIGDWGLGIGDWGLGIWGWGQYPKPQTPNPQSPLKYKKIIYLK
jgi:hypothetical protein